MQYAMEFERLQADFLQIGARRRFNEAFFLKVNQGGVLLRIGQNEYLIQAKQGVWLPSDCLCALTLFPNTKYDKMTFSVRCASDWPMYSGMLAVSPLILALSDHLMSPLTESAQKNALMVLKDVIFNHHKRPLEKLMFCSAAQLTQDLSVPLIGIPKEMADALSVDEKTFRQALLVRESVRLTRSGQSNEKIAAKLGYSQADLNALHRAFLGDI
jgi:hypothetical protein